jgi:hypothetical protein
MAAYYAQLRDLSADVILPNAGRGPDAFYDPKTGALRADVDRIYHADLRFLDKISRRSATNGAEVITILATRSGPNS